MAEIKRLCPSSNHHQIYSKPLFPELDPQIPPLQPKDFSLPPMRRGSMYSVYAELREWKLRRKKAEMNSMTATPTRRTAASSVSCSVPDFSMDFRKENRKPAAAPLPPTGPRSYASLTPPRPTVPKAELRRPGSTLSRRDEEKRRGGSGVFEMRKSYSCLKEFEYGVAASSAIDVEAKGRQSTGKGNIKKIVPSFRRQTTTWMA